MSEDGVLLNITIDGSSGNPNACITLNKSQVKLLSDCLKIYIDNNLIEEDLD